MGPEKSGLPGFPASRLPGFPASRFFKRLLFAGSAAAAAAAVLWLSGVDFEDLSAAHRAKVEPHALSVPVARSAGPTTAAAQPSPIGTDSSVSSSAHTLLLVSIQVGRNAQEGHVQLGLSALSPQTYRAGAILANGTRIGAVYSDHVDLERDGKTASVYVPGHEPTGYQPPDPAYLSVGGPHEFVPAVATSRDALTEVMRVSPVYDGAQVTSLEVYGSTCSDAFERLGLEAGDRITAIDGEPVRDRRQAIASLRRLTGGSALQVAINRRGMPMELSLDGASVTPRTTRTQ